MVQSHSPAPANTLSVKVFKETGLGDFWLIPLTEGCQSDLREMSLHGTGKCSWVHAASSGSDHAIGMSEVVASFKPEWECLGEIYRGGDLKGDEK